jgi:hypothetical protein
MPKFGRIYELKVEVLPNEQGESQGFVTIALPFTLEFTVTRQSLGSAQTAVFKIKNLKEETRNLLYHDQYTPQIFRAVQFRAGYGTFKPLVFNGTLKKAYSYRTGVDFITELECYDGGFQMVNGFTSLTNAAGETAADVIIRLSKTLPKITAQPIVGSWPVASSRGEVLFGNTWDIILDKSEGKANIDNGQVKVLRDNEVIQGEIPLINSDSGLLGSPKRTNKKIEFDIVFEPRVTLGQVVQLESQTNRIFNGTYKVMGFEHTGIISPSVGGQCKTSCSLWLGTEIFTMVTGVPVQ